MSVSMRTSTGGDLPIQTICRMAFPSSYDRERRQSLKGSLLRDRKLLQKYSRYFQIIDEAHNSSKKGFVAGEVFRTLCLLAQRERKVPSVRFMEYAIQNGFIYEDFQANFPIKSFRRYMSEYQPVIHLWAAEADLNNTSANRRLLSTIHLDPGAFLTLADWFRRKGNEAGLIPAGNKKLWMPQGWASIKKNIENQKEAAQSLIDFEKQLCRAYKTYLDEKMYAMKKEKGTETV